MRLSLPIISIIGLLSCHQRGEPAADPGSPAPVVRPAAGPAVPSPQRQPNDGVGGAPTSSLYPARATDAPLIRVQEALMVDSLLGHRVRVAGHCTAVGEGARAGSWTLADDKASIEVRGLVPASCTTRSDTLTIFAQIEPTKTGSQERLLLRLPD